MNPRSLARATGVWQYFPQRGRGCAVSEQEEFFREMNYRIRLQKKLFRYGLWAALIVLALLCAFLVIVPVAAAAIWWIFGPVR